MARAKGKFAAIVSGSIENNAAHYMFTKNGKTFVGFVRKGWNRVLQSAEQMQNAVKFAYCSSIANLLAIAAKAGGQENILQVIGAAFRTIRHGEQVYFYDDTLFEGINEIFKKHGLTLDLFEVVEIRGTEDDNIKMWGINKEIQLPQKTAVNYSFAAWLHAATAAQPAALIKIYSELAEVRGSELEDPAELAEIWDGLHILQLNFCRWCRVPIVEDISTAAYEQLKAAKKAVSHYGQSLEIFKTEAAAIKALE